MNKPLNKPLLPILPKGEKLRQYDRDLFQQLQQTFSDITEQVNSQVQTVGKPITSSPTINVSNALHHVTGTAQIVTIKAPAGFTGPIFLFADGAWTIENSGNVTIGLTAVVGRCYQLVFDGRQWFPVNVI